MSDSSNDDGAAIPPPLTTKMPLSATRAGAEMREMCQAWEAMALVRETTQATLAAAARATRQVPEPTRATLAAAAEATSLRTARTPVGSTT